MSSIVCCYFHDSATGELLPTGGAKYPSTMSPAERAEHVRDRLRYYRDHPLEEAARVGPYAFMTWTLAAPHGLRSVSVIDYTPEAQS